MLLALELSLSGEAGFDYLKELMAAPLGKLIVFGLLAALAYHFVAGIKHLIMDTGLGETLAGGKFAAQLTIFFSVVLIALAALWVI